MFQSWRGTIGYIKPSFRPGSLEEFIRLLPEGVGVIPLIVGIKAEREAFRERQPWERGKLSRPCPFMASAHLTTKQRMGQEYLLAGCHWSAESRTDWTVPWPYG